MGVQGLSNSSDWTPRREEISFGRRLEQGVTLHGLPALRVCSGRQRGRRFHSQHCVSLSLLLILSLSADSSEKGRTRGRSGRPLLPSFPTAWRLPLLPLAAKTAASMSDPPKVSSNAKYGILIEDARTKFLEARTPQLPQRAGFFLPSTLLSPSPKQTSVMHPD